MSQNIQQIFVANPASSMVSTDLLYLGRSPYGPTDDFAITFANFVASIGTATPTSSTIPRWDAHVNMSANNFLAGFASTATAAATTTLTVSSAYNQYFTGTTTQTAVLPVTSTLALGFPFRVINNSTGVVTVQSSGANTIQAMAPGSALLLTCILTSGTTAASWDAQYVVDADVSGAVLLNPGADQLIVGAHNLLLTAGNFIVGSTIAPLPAIQIQAVGVIGSSGINSVFTYDNVADSANFHAYKSASAAIGVYSAVGSAEPLGSFTAYGDDGTQFTPAARIRAFANGTVSNGVVPGQWEFLTANSSGVLTLAATINAAQQLILANALLPASGGTGITSLGTGISTALGNNLNGSGAFAGTTSPTFVTPVLGVATATSINFGGSSLANYVTAGTFTPVFTFTNPGDISVSYSVQAGNYTRIGNVVNAQIQIVATPTWTTASGGVSITGLPIATTSASGFDLSAPFLPFGFAYPASATQLFLYAGTSATTMSMYGVTPTGTNPQVGTTQFVSGQAIQIHANFTYLV